MVEPQVTDQDPAELEPPQDPPHGPLEDDDAPVTAGDPEGDPRPPDWPGADPHPSTGDTPALGQEPAPITGEDPAPITGEDLGWYRCPKCGNTTPATPIDDGERQPPCPACQELIDAQVEADAGV